MIYDVIIVGSGISAMGASLELTKKKLKVAIVDYGLQPPTHLHVDQNLYDFTESTDAFDLLIGQDFQGLVNLKKNSPYVPARLATPGFSFVTQRTQDLAPVHSKSFSAVQSLAAGGLANAWGAGAYRFLDHDLKGFPFSASELEPFYDELTKEIGISGENDELSRFFGKDSGLQPPLQMSENARGLLAKYRSRKSKFQKLGVTMGRPRFAVLSEATQGRRPLQYQNLEFWQPHLPEIYTPAYTLKKLIAQRLIDYHSGFLVESFESKNTDGSRTVTVTAKDQTGRSQTFAARKLFLAAGTINSAKIVLQSSADFTTSLPLVDNLSIQVPLVLPWRIGRKLERRSFGSAHLNTIMVDDRYSSPLQGSILDLGSPARGEFFDKFPFSARTNLAFIKYVLPAMAVNLFFFPSDIQPPAKLKRNRSGELEIESPPNTIGDDIIAKVIKMNRLLGAWTHAKLVVRVPGGGGIHYAGCLPMTRNSDRPYTCSHDGELFGHPSVYVVDGAGFPQLPAKNHSFTLMANAMRIARVARFE